MWTSVGEIGRPLYIARTYLMSLFQKNDDGDDDRDEIGLITTISMAKTFFMSLSFKEEDKI